MGSTSMDDMMVTSNNEVEGSEATVEIKIKTLDSQTHILRVNKYVPVPALKEQIATVTGVLSEQQRLICRGKVLQDNELLSAYHVEDGHTLHMVVRQPFQASSTAMNGLVGTGPGPVSSFSSNLGSSVTHGVLYGSVNSDQGDGLVGDINRLVSVIFNSFGVANGGIRNEGTDPGTNTNGRSSQTVGAELNANQSAPQANQQASQPQIDPHPVGSHFSTPVGSLTPPVIPDSLVTMYQYLSRMRHELDAIRQAGGQGDLAQASYAQMPPANTQSLLPRPAALAEIMLSTRLLLLEQTGDCLSILARQLQDEANVTSAMQRSNLQSCAARSGVILQNLGSLLLELGRTTMTLRLGQTTSEAVVNAGPAVFISTSGPNPMMVQPLPFQPGTTFGSIPMGAQVPSWPLAHSTVSTGLIPRNVDIRIHAVSAGSNNQAEHQSQHRQFIPQDHARTSGSRTSPNQPSTVPTRPQSLAVESGGVRLVPVQAVVAAVPTAVPHPQPGAASSNPFGLLYPFLARFQQVGGREQPNHANSATATGHQSRSSETDGRPSVTQPDVQTQYGEPQLGVSLESRPLLPNLSSNEASFPSDRNPTMNSETYQASVLFSSSTSEGFHSFIPDMESMTSYTALPLDATSNGFHQGFIPQTVGGLDQLFRSMFPGEQVHSDVTSIPEPQPDPQNPATTNELTTDETSNVPLQQGIFLSSILQRVIPVVQQKLALEAGSSSAASEVRAVAGTSESLNVVADLPSSSLSENRHHQASEDAEISHEGQKRPRADSDAVLQLDSDASARLKRARSV